VKINKEILQITLNKHYTLLVILLGSVLVTISLGPYSNGDAQVEYSAAAGIITWGVPYMTFGNPIDQPPLGFYIDASIFKIFGLSYETGVSVITLFGLGCVFLVYEMGKVFYGKRTGLIAAALFGLTPWHVVMSRVFLIDAQCLFFSLLCLLVGIRAMRKESLVMLFVSGTLFGLALLTKAFAVFMLIPLSLFYIYWRPKDLKHVPLGIALFFLPAFLLHYLWYEIISGRGLFILFSHGDFISYFPEGKVPSNFFLLSYFIQNPGVFLLGACALSLILSISQRKLFSKVIVSDVACFLTIIFVASINMYLVLGKNLWIPYVDPAKYAYLILPSFCCLAASLVDKFFLLHGLKNLGEQRKLIFYIAVIGLFLLMASMVMNMIILSSYTRLNSFRFMVEGDVGFPFDRLLPVSETPLPLVIQGLAFVAITLSLFWFNKDKLRSLHKLTP